MSDERRMVVFGRAVLAKATVIYKYINGCDPNSKVTTDHNLLRSTKTSVSKQILLPTFYLFENSTTFHSISCCYSLKLSFVDKKKILRGICPPNIRKYSRLCKKLRLQLKGGEMAPFSSSPRCLSNYFM